MTELFRRAQEIAAFSQEFMVLYLEAAAVYWVVCLALSSGQSVPRGQWEAAHMIGMPRALALRRIILPQAARVSVPPLSNEFISLVKDTSLASLILVTELFREAQQIAAFSQKFMVLYVEAAAVYWVICLFLSGGQTVLEKRLERHVAH